MISSQLFETCLIVELSWFCRQAPNFAIKNLPDSTIRLIVCIDNGCLALNHFPKPWKLAKIFPVLKTGKNRLLDSSYRPISLLNSITKTYKKLILFHMPHHIRGMMCSTKIYSVSRRTIPLCNNLSELPTPYPLTSAGSILRECSRWTCRRPSTRSAMRPSH